MSPAVWAGAADQAGLAYDAIHLNPRGAELMAQVVKVAMGLDETRPKPPTIAATSPEPPPRVSAQTSKAVEQDSPVIVRETRIVASGRASPQIERTSAVPREAPATTASIPPRPQASAR